MDRQETPARPVTRRLTKTRIFLADDHLIFAEALKQALDRVDYIEIAGIACDGREAIGRIAELKPDIAVLDISMPGLDGIEITRQVTRYYPETRIILLSSYDDDKYVKEAIQAGVKGYVLKSASQTALIEAIDAVSKGEFYLSSQITSLLIGTLSGNAKSSEAHVQTKFDQLSDREREVLRLITEGKNQREIAALLFLSEATVKSHRHNIMKKLDIHKSVDLVKQALKSGLIKM